MKITPQLCGSGSTAKRLAQASHRGRTAPTKTDSLEVLA